MFAQDLEIVFTAWQLPSGIFRRGAVGIQQKSELQNFCMPLCFGRHLIKILKLVLLVPFFVSFLGKFITFEILNPLK